MNANIQPYKGLRPYEESDQGNFFGREVECKILLDKFLASRLTLLFAASGVGKSSLLQAAVLPRLKDSRQENRDAVYYKDWVSEPLTGIQQHIRANLEQTGTISHDMWPQQAEKMSLRDFLAFATLFVRQPLVLLLDQFEEFFQYHRYTASFQPFIAELTAAITDRDLPLSVVISMREDFALELNAFKPALPTLLFENFYRLEPLSRDNAIKAIVEPVQQLGFDYEQKLLNALLEDLASREERSLASSPFAIAPDTVEPAYLQIVCAQLWEADKSNPDKLLLWDTYDKKQRAAGILKNYIDDIIKSFSSGDKSLASQAFDHLITRRGTKLAYTAADLAKTLGAKTSDLEKVLDELQQRRILRRQLRQAAINSHINAEERSGERVNATESSRHSGRDRRNPDSMDGLGIVSAGETPALLGESENLGDFQGSLPPFAKGGQGGLKAETVMAEDSQSPLTPLLQRGELVESSQEYALAQNRHNITPGDVIPSEVFWYELYHDLFSKPIENWNNLYKAQQRNRKALRMAASAVVFGFALYGAYDAAMNLTQYQFKLNGKKGNSNAIELYQGQVGSPDFFHLGHYLAEAGYQGWEIEPDKLRIPQAVSQYKNLNGELIGNLPLEDRISAYWEDGQATRALELAKQAFNEEDTERAKHTILLLTSFRSGLVVPILADSLDKFSNIELKRKLIQSLAAIGGKEAGDRLRKALKNPLDNQLQEDIIHAMGYLGDTEAIDLLVPLLNHAEQTVRQTAITTLGNLGTSAALKSLQQNLENTHAEVCWTAAGAIGRWHDSLAVEPLLKHLADADPDVTEDVIGALAQLGDVRAVEPLIAKLNDPSSKVRKSAVQALGKLSDTKALQPLLSKLDDPDPEVREAVVNALVAFRGSEILEPLLAKLDDPDPTVRKTVVNALIQLRDTRAVQPLLAKLDDTDPTVREAVIDALGQLGDTHALAPLLKKLTDRVPAVRVATASSLGTLEDKKAFGPLFQKIIDPNQKVRNAVVAALIQLADKSRTQFLIKELDNDNELVRQASAKILGKLHDLQAVPTLLDHLNDVDYTTKDAIIDALEQSGDKRATEPLFIQYKNHLDYFGPYNEDDTHNIILAKLGGTDLATRLAQSINEENASAFVVSAYAGLLIHMDDAVAKEPLLVAFHRIKSSVLIKDSIGRRIIIKLVNMDNLSIDALLSGLGNAYAEIDEEAMSALAKNLKHDAIPSITQHLKTAMDMNELNFASGILTPIGNARGLYTILRHCARKDTNINYIVANNKIKDTRLSNSLLQRINYMKPNDDGFAAVQISNMLDQRVFPSLHRMVLFRNRSSNAAISTLVRMGDKQLLPKLRQIAITNDYNNDAAISALGKLGDKKSINLLLGQLQSSADTVQTQALLALAKITGESILDKASAIFDKPQQAFLPKLAAAIVLLKFKHDDGLAWLQSQIADIHDENKQEIAKILGEFSTPHSPELLKALLADPDKEVQLAAIQSIGNIKAVELQDDLIALLKNTTGDRQAAAATALGQLGTEPALQALQTLVWNDDAAMRVRLIALEEVGRPGRAQAIRELTKAIDQDEEAFGLVAYRLLGELGEQARAVLPKLLTRFHQIEGQYPQWRKLRDEEPPDTPEEQDKVAFKQHKAWKDEMDKKQPEDYWVFPLAQAIARIDPEQGMALLSHNLADARYGAWTGLGQKADAKLVQRLHKARLSSQDPLFRHAAYRAIDESLMRLEVTANANEDLTLLKNLYQTAQNEEGIGTRLEWTIQQIEKRQE